MTLRRVAASLLASSILAACAAHAPASELEADGAGEAYSTFRSPSLQGFIEPGDRALATFAPDDRVHAFDFTLDRTAEVRLYTYGEGASPAVDTVLYLYRASADGTYGGALARNDDAHNTGYSDVTKRLSPGTYRVLVRASSALTRASYRLAFDCPGCLAQDVCVFGPSIGFVRRGVTVQVEQERTIDSPTQLSDIERLQLVDALHASSHTDVTTAEEALARVDGNEVSVLHLWDPSRAEAFVAFEYGAGDNAYGRIFRAGSLSRVATISDGDLTECAVAKGRLSAECKSDRDCGNEGRCTGIEPVRGRGKCAPKADPAGVGLSCSETAACPTGGLRCAGRTRGDEGVCQPSWMTSQFSDWYGTTIADGRPEGTSRYIDAYGLATVDTDVAISLVIRHPAVEQLRVFLTNPAGAEAVVYDGSQTGRDLVLENAPAYFSGDESVNGRWTLRIEDKKRGQVGSLERWSLRIGSRWD